MNGFFMISVWEAAIGKPTSLASLLRSDMPLSAELRNEIALLIEGKLIAKKRKRGRPASPEYPSVALAKRIFSPEHQAIENYHRVAKWLRKRNKLYGERDNLAASIARKWDLGEETFLNALARSQKPPPIQYPLEHETAGFEMWLSRKTRPAKVRK